MDRVVVRIAEKILQVRKTVQPNGLSFGSAIAGSRKHASLAPTDIIT